MPYRFKNVCVLPEGDDINYAGADLEFTIGDAQDALAKTVLPDEEASENTGVLSQLKAAAADKSYFSDIRERFGREKDASSSQPEGNGEDAPDAPREKKSVFPRIRLLKKEVREKEDEETVSPMDGFHLQMTEKGKILILNENDEPERDPLKLLRIRRSRDYRLQCQELRSQHHKELSEHYDLVNAQTDRFVNFDSYIPSVDNISAFQDQVNLYRPKTYERLAFEQEEPDELKIREELLRSQDKHILDYLKRHKLPSEQDIDDQVRRIYLERHKQWENDRLAHLEAEDRKLTELNARYMSGYDNVSGILGGMLNSSPDIILPLIGRWLSSVTLPAKVTASYGFDLFTNSLYLDLHFPRKEFLPLKSARWALGRHSVVEYEKTDLEINQEFARFTFNTAVFLSSHLFNLVPSIRIIYCSGFVPGQYKEEGLADDAIFSLKFDRMTFENDKPGTVDIIDYCSAPSQNRVNFSTEMAFQLITPYALDN